MAGRFALLLTLLPGGLALGQTISAIESIPIVLTCLAQDPASANAFWNRGAQSQAGPGAAAPRDQRETWKPALEDSSWAACVRRKQWVSRDFCRDLLDVTVEGRSDMAGVM